MKVRFGYVAIAMNLKDASTSKTITLGNLQKLANPEAQEIRLQRLVKENLENTLRVLRYNKAEGIEVYRLTSKLVPFATYPLGFDWNYREKFAKEFAKIGEFIREAELRISAHPDHFTVVNTPDENVFRESVKDLEYHENLFAAMGLGVAAKLVTHVGGFYGNKEKSLARFAENFKLLPQKVQERLVVENDDKVYTAEQVLLLCESLAIPMVLDLHHHQCNPGGELGELLPRIWKTWGNGLPKIHVSSPKDCKNIRAHADNVLAEPVYEFLKLARELGQDFDVMVEAKLKDQAMLRLVKELSSFDDIKQETPGSISFG